MQLDPGALPTFLQAFKTSPVMLPFDATASPGGQSIANLLNNSINKTLSFPPPVACLPGLNATQLGQINAVETTAFALDPVQKAQTQLDTSCFANRPVYGVLDVLRARLPFADGRKGVAQQAVILNSDASVRAILHSGEILSALPGSANVTITEANIDPRRFGTLSHLNHIALKWLQAFPTTNLAVEAAKFLLTSPTVPPTSESILFNANIPPVEVAVFGVVFLSDISSFVSSFSTPTGSLFFGSSQGQSFRKWALQNPSTIAWSSSASSPQVVHETQATNSAFEQVWTGSEALIQKGATDASTVAVVTNALGGQGLFSP